MNRNDEIPLLLRHRGEGLIPQDSSIGYEDVYTAKLFYGSLGDRLPIFSGANSRDGFPPS